MTTVPSSQPNTSAPPDAPAEPSRTGGRKLWPIMVSLVLALIPVQLDGLVAATAMPTIAGDLGGFDRIAWIATSFLLAMAIGTVVAGRLGDMFGRRRLLLAALAVFFLGSLWSGISTSMTELILARALQGIGAGMTFTSLLASVADIAPPEKRARYQGVFGAVAPFSMIIGPWVGGLITDHLGWRWIFLLNLPLVAIAMTGIAVLLRLPKTHRGGRVDVAGLISVSVAAAGIVLAVSWGGNQYPWLSWQVIGAAMVGLLGVAATVYAERRAVNPVLPLDLFRNRSVLMAFCVMALAPGAVMMASMNYLPVFLQVVQGHSASNSGLLLLPMLLPAIAVAMLVGGWTSKGNRFRPVMIAGTALLAVSSALLATMTSGTPGLLTAVFMVLGGAGIGLLFQTPLVLVQNSAPAGEVGAATGAASFLRSVGGAIGVGGLGALFGSRFSDYLTSHPATGTAGMSIGDLGPAQLAALPADAHRTVIDAAVSANSILFWAAAVVAALAVVAAWAVPRMTATERTVSEVVEVGR
ncbi:MFS transporter [Nakamurella lactea]|uniref:MFS transporter n=1 Tax=Nakamurella lactea TaxID=459515 RepID=UPI000A014321|nr:MFS transporter [Nakamurella lactea]